MVTELAQFVGLFYVGDRWGNPVDSMGQLAKYPEVMNYADAESVSATIGDNYGGDARICEYFGGNGEYTTSTDPDDIQDPFPHKLIGDCRNVPHNARKV